LTNSSQRREVNTEADDTRFVRIYSDGNAGTGTVTLTLVDLDSGASLSLGSFSYESTGAVASLAVTSTRYTIGRAGGYPMGGALANRRAATEVPTVTTTGGTTSSPAFIVTTKDSGGRNASIAGGLVPTIVSSDPNVVSAGSCALDDGLDVDYSSSANGIGVYNCNFTTAATAKSGDKATLTVRTPDPASTTGGFLTATYNVTVGGSAATGTETITLDNPSYEPGEGMTLTLTAKDSAGNPVFDGEASPSVSFTKAVTGTRGASIYINGTRIK